MAENAEKTIRLAVSVQQRDKDGNVVTIPAGAPLTLPADEADALVARFGTAVSPVAAVAPVDAGRIADLEEAVAAKDARIADLEKALEEAKKAASKK